jgi:hypothetical protein
MVGASWVRACRAAAICEIHIFFNELAITKCRSSIGSHIADCIEADVTWRARWLHLSARISKKRRGKSLEKREAKFPKRVVPLGFFAVLDIFQARQSLFFLCCFRVDAK